MNGTILNVQHYAVHDGPGIRTLVFLKGCPLHCYWCCNPESQSSQPQVRYISFRCKACLECVIHCPSSSISSVDSVIHRSFDHCNQCHSRVCIEKCNYDAITLSGKVISSDELAEIIALDIPFYRNSGGGVTFSGGEPLMQPAFLLDVLKKCKKLDIHTAVETCGWTGRKTLQRILPFTDLFLFDLKIIDPELHLAFTGKPVGPVLANLAFLAAEKDIPRAAHSCSAQISRLLYFPDIHISRIFIFLSRLPPGLECRAFAAALACSDSARA